MGGQGELRGWVEDDFVDEVSSQPLVENDPWDPNVPPSAPGLSLPGRLGSESEANTAHQADLDSASDFVDELADIDPGDQWSEGAFDPPTEWAEPDPTIDASSELSESLYPSDSTITDISRDLKIGELLAHMEPFTEEQRARCHEVLSACGIGRLRRWIPWLRSRDWCGAKLQLFLEFRRHWESNANARWWEIFRWDHREQEWMPRYQPGTLSLDQGRELVDNRAHCDVADVIDPVWFLEWEDCAAWELGVESFARFAVFRAGIPDGDDWQQRLTRQDRRTQLDRAQCADGSFAPFMLPSFAQQYGLSRGVGTRPDPWLDVTEMARRKGKLLVTGY